jgi:uncharacterized Zn-finger protein
MNPPETVDVETATVACEGNGPATGHPRVFLTLVDGKVDCPYCGQRFRQKAGSAVPAH